MITIPRRNWHMELADAIESAEPDETIEVHSDDMRELAKSAHQRMCPTKPLTFVVKDLPVRSVT